MAYNETLVYRTLFFALSPNSPMYITNSGVSLGNLWGKSLKEELDVSKIDSLFCLGHHEKVLKFKLSFLLVRFSCTGSIVRLKLSCESLTCLNFKSCCFHCFKLKPRYIEQFSSVPSYTVFPRLSPLIKKSTF